MEEREEREKEDEIERDGRSERKYAALEAGERKRVGVRAETRGGRRRRRDFPPFGRGMVRV